MGHARLATEDHSASWPAYLQKAARQTKLAGQTQKPLVIAMRAADAAEQLETLVEKQVITEVIDNYDEQLAELLLSHDAHLYRANASVQQHSIAEHLKEHYGSTPAWKLGCWVYYPWNGRLVHVIAKELFSELRTIRNRDLISASEQQKLASFRVACLGMSVGSSSALAHILSGISDRIKLADGAVISGSNLNRILTGVASIGKAKTLVIEQQLYEMNPYLDVHALPGKLTKETMQELFEKPWPVDLVVDEIDDLEMKIRVRLEARKRGIPVIMATELGDNVMLDVERFDLDPKRPLFHGMIPGVEGVLDKQTMSQREWIKYATAIIDPPNIPLNMQQSLLKIGTHVVTHPQLGTTAMLTGAVLAFATKQIALGKPFASQRTSISLEKTFIKEFRSFRHRRRHAKHTKVLKRSLDAM